MRRAHAVPKLCIPLESALAFAASNDPQRDVHGVFLRERRPRSVRRVAALASLLSTRARPRTTVTLLRRHDKGRPNTTV
jgi:hypothetical protein